MKRLIFLILITVGILTTAFAKDNTSSERKRNKHFDYQFVTSQTQQTDIESSFYGCSFGSPQAAVEKTLNDSADIKISESSYGHITLAPVFFNDFLFQTASLLFTNNQLSNVLFGSTFKDYEDALGIYLRIKQYLAHEYGPSVFKQKKTNMANFYDLNGKNACMLSLTKQTDKDGTIRFNLILNYWNKSLQPQK